MLKSTSMRYLLPLLAMCSALGPMASHIILPLLDAVRLEFGVSYSAATLTISAFLISVGIAQSGVGALADKFGRKRVLIGGLILFSLASWGIALSSSLSMLIALRAVQGASSCVGIICAKAVVSDVLGDRASSSIAYLVVVMSSSTMLAPIIGGVLGQWSGWRPVFLILGMVCAFAMLLVWRYMRETFQDERPARRGLSIRSSFRHLIGDPRFLAFASITGLVTGAFYAFVAATPYISLHLLHLSPSAYGAWFAVFAVGIPIGAFITSRLSIGVHRLVIVGAAGMAVATSATLSLLLTDLANHVTFFLIMGLSSVFMGIINSNAQFGTVRVQPERAGAAAGLAGTLQFSSAAVFSWLGGTLTEATQSAVPVFVLMISSLALALFVAISRHTNL